MIIANIILVVLTLGLVVYELYGIYIARKKGLTKNISRLITHALMTILLLILLAQVIYFAVRFSNLSSMFQQ